MQSQVIRSQAVGGTRSSLSSTLNYDRPNPWAQTAIPGLGNYIGFVAPRLTLQAVPPERAGRSLLYETSDISTIADNHVASLDPSNVVQNTPSGKGILLEGSVAILWHTDPDKRVETAQKFAVSGGPVVKQDSSHSSWTRYSATNTRRTELCRTLDGIVYSIRIGCTPLAVIKNICDDRKINSTHDAERASKLVLGLVNMTHRRNGYLPWRFTSDVFTKPVVEVLPSTLQKILIVVRLSLFLKILSLTFRLNQIDAFEASNTVTNTQFLKVFALETSSWCRLAGFLYIKGVIVTEVVYKLLAILLGPQAQSRVRYKGVRALLECTGARLCANGANWRVGSIYGSILRTRLAMTGPWMPVYDEIWVSLTMCSGRSFVHNRDE